MSHMWLPLSPDDSSRLQRVFLHPTLAAAHENAVSKLAAWNLTHDDEAWDELQEALGRYLDQASEIKAAATEHRCEPPAAVALRCTGILTALALVVGLLLSIAGIHPGSVIGYRVAIGVVVFISSVVLSWLLGWTAYVVSSVRRWEEALL